MLLKYQKQITNRNEMNIKLHLTKCFQLEPLKRSCSYFKNNGFFRKKKEKKTLLIPLSMNYKIQNIV